MRSLRNASIRTKFGLGFGVALALIVLVGAFSLFQLRSVNTATLRLTEISLPRVEQLGSLKQATSEHWLLAARRFQTTNFRDLASILNGMREAREAIERTASAYRKSNISAEEASILDDFLTLWNDYLSTLRVASQRHEAGEISAAVHEFNSIAYHAFESADKQLDRLIQISHEKSSAAARDADRAYRLALAFTLLAVLFAVGCIATASIWLSKNISRPILRVSEAMRRLTEGDDSIEISVDRDRNDEIGILMSAASGYRRSLLQSREFAAQAEQERERLNAAITNMPIGLAMFDADKRLIVCNDCYASMYQLPPELTRAGTPLTEILESRDALNLIGEESLDRYTRRVADILRSGRTTLSMVELRNGHVLSIIHQPMAGGGWVSTHEDVTERRRAEEQIYHMARHDALTNLPNRFLFGERARQVLAEENSGEVAVLCLDLDRFKPVNDTLGHAVGDLLLKDVSDRLRRAVAEGDMVARIGGDEFAIVQVGTEQPANAKALAERIIQSLSAPYLIDDHQLVISASVGIAIAPIDGTSAEALLKHSDMALYRAKADGRNTYRFFEQEMDARMQVRRALELELRRALIESEFEVHYQPSINVDSGDVTGFEALLRWRHPHRGLVPPNEFIPLAEEIGLIGPIGEWVLRQACTDAAGWPADLKVAVNLSPAQFQSKGVLEAVIKALAFSRLAPERLELEITENVLLLNSEATLSALHQLRSLGVRIAMDDFGTGYSSLSYLRQFPYDKIKIDGSFVRAAADEPSSLAIIRAVTGLGTSLGISTTAEGVETKEQLERIRSEGCTEVQGFYFSEAKPAREITTLLNTLRKRAKAAA